MTPTISSRGDDLNATHSRPTSVTVAAVVGIVVALLSLICDGAGLLTLMAQVPRREAPAADLPSWIKGLNVVSAVVSVGLAIAWLGLSIALLRMSRSSRRWALRLAVAQAIYMIAMLSVQVTFFAPVTARYIREEIARESAAQKVDVSPEFQARVATVTAYSYPAITFGLGMILPLVMFFVLRRPVVARAFDAQSDAGLEFGSHPDFLNPLEGRRAGLPSR